MPPVVTLRPMTEAEYAAYLPGATEAYALEVARNNLVSEEEGLARSQRSFETELPDGIHTPDQRLLIAEDAEGERIGYLWLARKAETDTVFIYDIEVVEARRGEGFGRRLMELVEVEGRAMGLQPDRAQRPRRQRGGAFALRVSGLSRDATPDGQAARLTVGKDRPETRS